MLDSNYLDTKQTEAFREDRTLPRYILISKCENLGYYFLAVSQIKLQIQWDISWTHLLIIFHEVPTSSI